MCAEEGQYVMIPAVEGGGVPAVVLDDFYKVGCFIHELLIWGENGRYVAPTSGRSYGRTT